MATTGLVKGGTVVVADIREGFPCFWGNSLISLFLSFSLILSFSRSFYFIALTNYLVAMRRRPNVASLLAKVNQAQ